MSVNSEIEQLEETVDSMIEDIHDGINNRNATPVERQQSVEPQNML